MVGVMTLGIAVLAGVFAARVFGGDSPLFWSIAIVACLAAGMVFIGRPELHTAAARLERAADADGDGSEDDSPRGSRHDRRRDA